MPYETNRETVDVILCTDGRFWQAGGNSALPVIFTSCKAGMFQKKHKVLKTKFLHHRKVAPCAAERKIFCCMGKMLQPVPVQKIPDIYPFFSLEL